MNKIKVVDFNGSIKEKIILLLGNFDGLHQGHFSLIQKARQLNGKIAILTFNGAYKGKVIKTLEERIAQYERFKLDYTIVCDFDKIKMLSGEQFLSYLLKNFNIDTIVTGKNFKFGLNAQNNTEDIEKFCNKNNIKCCFCEEVKGEKEKISSSDIKLLLSQKNILKANHLLLEDYSVMGKVVHGKNMANKLGFATMNINIEPEKDILKHGVYAVYTFIDGKKYFGVANYGEEPTFNIHNVSLEVHLIDFDKDMYDKKVEISFIEYLRDIKKFNDVDSLKREIEKDIVLLRRKIC